MAKVVLLPLLEDKLFDIVFMLYNKEYFGFLESAFSYVDEIVNFIYTIPTLSARAQKIKNTVILLQIQA